MLQEGQAAMASTGCALQRMIVYFYIYSGSTEAQSFEMRGGSADLFSVPFQGWRVTRNTCTLLHLCDVSDH